MKTSPFLVALALLPCMLQAQTLDEQLDNAFGPEERREVLRDACMNSARKLTGQPPRVIRHRLQRLPNKDTREFQDFCNRMNEVYHESTDPGAEGAEADQKRSDLAEECSDLIRNRLENEDSSSLKAYQNLRSVCEGMTGRRVKTPFDKPTTQGE